MKINGRTLEVMLFFAARSRKEFSGYDLSKALGIASGTLYPLLVKMEGAGLLYSRWEDGDPQKMGRPRRRYYRINGQGIRAVTTRMRDIDPRYALVAGNPEFS